MAEISFPWDMFLKAQQEKNRNAQQMNQDIAGLGQGLGQAAGGIGQIIQQQKQQALMKQLMQAMQTQGAPQQGPPLPPPGTQTAGVNGVQDATIPTQTPGQQPTSGIGGPSQDNTQLIQRLIMQMNPEMGMKAYIDQHDPYKQSLESLYKSEAEKNIRPPAPKPEYQPESGVLSEDGKTVMYDKFTGKEMKGDIPVKSTGYGSTMGGIRLKQYTMQDLPSNQPPTTSGGAAYQVKIGARQGKALIGKPGSPQRTGAARADLARAITRVAPTDEGLRGINFTDNLAQRWSMLKQQITVDPSVVDNPKIRKEMYDIFDDMEKASTPFIVNQLDEMETQGFNITPMTRKRQLGETMPNIPFEESAVSATGGLTPQEQAELQRLEAKFGKK
jgi:hypothetical protein